MEKWTPAIERPPTYEFRPAIQGEDVGGVTAGPQAYVVRRLLHSGPEPEFLIAKEDFHERFQVMDDPATVHRAIARRIKGSRDGGGGGRP